MSFAAKLLTPIAWRICVTYNAVPIESAATRVSTMMSVEDDGSVPADLHPNERERLASLYSYAILDTPVEAAFDDITRIASYICQTPVAVVNLIDAERQWFKSEVGLGIRETPRHASFCPHAILEHNYLEIPDTLEDVRFARNPMVVGKPYFRFYAGALLRTPDGFPLGTVCVLDRKPRSLTTDQRDLLTALARQAMSQMELRRALHLSLRLQGNVTRLMATAGHDLKQPLQVMIMAIDRVRSRLPDPREQQRLSYAVDAGMRMASELDRLAESSATVSHAPKLQPIAIKDVFTSVRDTWMLHAERKGLDLRIAPIAAYVLSDPAMLRSMIGNLVGNAIKYTEHGGVLIGCRKRGPYLSIEVLDTGVGIADSKLDDIFHAFHQIDPRSEGLGLGLSIVKSGAEALNHKVSVRSVKGKGSHFTVLVPLAQRYMSTHQISGN